MQGAAPQHQQPDRHRGGAPEAALAVNVQAGVRLLLVQPLRDRDELLRAGRAAIRHRDMTARDAELIQHPGIRERFFPQIDDVGDPRRVEADVFIRRQGAPDMEPVVDAVDALGRGAIGLALGVGSRLGLIGFRAFHLDQSCFHRRCASGGYEQSQDRRAHLRAGLK